MWVVEINKRIFSKPEWEEEIIRIGAKKRKYHWIIETEQRKEVETKLKKIRVSQQWYKKEWKRSSNYRQIFFENNQGPYRCRYCNRRLKKEYLQVDHLVPVDKVEKTEIAKLLLKLRGIEDVNNIRNLVPSCGKCNRAKGNNMGWWYLRGIFGQYKWYWVGQKILAVILIIISMYLILFVLNW